MHYYTATKAVMLNYWNFINQVKKDKEMHCFTATKPIGPTSPVVRCFCEAESQIVVFRVADRCSFVYQNPKRKTKNEKRKKLYIFCCTDAFLSKERVKRIVLQRLKRSDRLAPCSDVFVKLNPKLWCFGLLIGVQAPKRKKLYIFCCINVFLV